MSLTPKVNGRYIPLNSRHIACTISGENAYGRCANSTDSPVKRTSLHKRAEFWTSNKAWQIVRIALSHE